ncbi:hypothetical protein EUX98_g1881 [Antrodiella citrinella]|uniref:Uncharacterized protein n=1 Tax=Antrodiella citrinella TaxID=2447956 RepID=A0A4S4N091_9APHY|nr:hypothetical protein EUX98_g1881 [Antrodiella citrinella]
MFFARVAFISLCSLVASAAATPANFGARQFQPCQPFNTPGFTPIPTTTSTTIFDPTPTFPSAPPEPTPAEGVDSPFPEPTSQPENQSPPNQFSNGNGHNDDDFPSTSIPITMTTVKQASSANDRESILSAFRMLRRVYAQAQTALTLTTDRRMLGSLL